MKLLQGTRNREQGIYEAVPIAKDREAYFDSETTPRAKERLQKKVMAIERLEKVERVLRVESMENEGG